MSDENDLDEFARLFGARPETPPEGLLPPAEARPTAPAATPGAPGDPLGWLLNDGPAATAAMPPVDPDATAAFPSPATPTQVLPSHALPSQALPSQAPPSQGPAVAFGAPEPFPPATEALPTRRSVAAEAARASRDTGRRNLMILGGIGALVLVLIVVLIVVLVSKSGDSGSPDALLTQSASPSTSAGATASATPTPTPTVTPTPTPTPTQALAVAPPAPSPPTVTATVVAQPSCPSGATMTTLSIGYTTTNAATLNLSSSDQKVNMNITPGPSGTISSVPYDCGASNESYTLTVYSSAEGVTPGTATVTPVPTAG